MTKMNKKKYTNIIIDDGALAFCDIPLMWAAQVVPQALGRCVPFCAGLGGGITGDVMDMLMRVLPEKTSEWMKTLGIY